jgi:pSer/pThr/pTyr-binding forkhead associated (FHA) protein
MTNSKEPTPNPRHTLEKQLDLVVTQAGHKKGKAFLMVSAGEAAGTVFPLTHGDLLMGRSPDAAIRINEQAVSHEHARLEMTNGMRCTIRDLESTNGTYVNGQRIVGSVVLTGGDTIRAGSTIFTFVTRDVNVPAGTLVLKNADVQLPMAVRSHPPADHSRPAPDGREVRASAIRKDDMRSGELRRSGIGAGSGNDMHRGPASERETSISLTDVVRTVKTYWVYAKRYGWFALTCMCFGIALGVAQARLSPPPGSAWFEMTLSTEARGSDEEGLQFFVAAEQTFRSLPLIKRTLGELGAGDVSDKAAGRIQSALSFERAGFNSKLWRGDFQDTTAEQAVTFLKKHVDVYVSSEIDKILKVLRADAEFDRQQEADAQARVAEARGLLIEFIDEHPDAVPKDAKTLDVPPVRLAAGASPARIRERIGNVERALTQALQNIQSKKARPYLDQAAQAESKIAEAKSRGLGDQHPDVKNWASLAKTMRGKANQLINAEPSPNEQSLDEEVVRLKQDLADLKRRLADAPSARAAASADLVAAAGSDPPEDAARTAPDAQAQNPQSLAQLKLAYAELAREYERAKVDHEALLKKRETTDRQLERERTSAEARYDIITPPTPEAASIASATIKRAGMGGIVGLGLALIAAACLELRRTLIARGHL